jgi:hypothetical protein
MAQRYVRVFHDVAARWPAPHPTLRTLRLPVHGEVDCPGSRVQGALEAAS